MNTARARSTIAIGATVLLLGCAGSGGGPSLSRQPSAVPNAPLSIRLVVPAALTLHYVSSSTAELTVSVTPGTGPTLPTQTFPCTHASCSATVTVPVGNDTIALSLTDSGGGGTPLSLTSATPVTILPNVTNSLALTANPVVAHATLTLGAPGTVAAGSPVTTPLTLTVTDADGNTIVGPGNFVDGNGSPITLTIQSTNVGPIGNGSVTISGPTHITNPAFGSLSAQYNGQGLDHSIITLTANTGLVATSAPVAITTMPTVTAEYALPTGGAGANIIVLGADHRMWFAERNASKIGVIDATGAITEYPTPTGGAQPLGITLGGDGNVWFGENCANAVASITPAGVITEHPTSSAGCFNPAALNYGPGNNFWIALDHANKIEEMTPAGVVVADFPIPTGGFSGAYNTVTGPDGNTWFSEYAGNNIGRLTPGGAITEFPVPTGGSQPNGLAAGPDGNVWFCEHNGNTIDKITPSGVITEFPVPTSNAGPQNITAGPDGNLWFTEYNANAIAKITTSGVVTEYPIPSPGTGPYGLAFGSDGNLWFVENAANKIGKFVI